VPRKQRVIPPPDRPVSSWDLEHWNDVTTGYQVATETYELVPAHVGSKLHCSSCHLGAGRDPESAWWVGMFAKYKTPESPLQPDQSVLFAKRERQRHLHRRQREHRRLGGAVRSATHDAGIDHVSPVAG
jgi:cytochrome c